MSIINEVKRQEYVRRGMCSSQIAVCTLRCEPPVFWVLFFYLLLVSASSHDTKTTYTNLNDQKRGSKQTKLRFGYFCLVCLVFLFA